jgi:hypothetical protein
LRLIGARILLSARRAAVMGIAAFGVSAPAAAALVAAGRLASVPLLVDAGMALPVVCALAGLLAGAVKALALPKPLLAAWMDLRTGARGAVAAAAEVPPDNPLFALVRESAREALQRAGLRYLSPFLPAWAPIVLVAAALWGMAMLIPEPVRATGPVAVEYAAMLPGAGALSAGKSAPAQASWTRLIVAPMPAGTQGASAAEMPLPGLPKTLQRTAASPAASSESASEGMRTAETGRKGTGAMAAAGTPGAAIESADGGGVRGTAGAMETALPGRWQAVQARYTELLREEASR